MTANSQPDPIPGQGDLFNARAERNKSMARVERNAGEEWNAYAARFIAQYARDNLYVFGDDLWSAGLEEPPNDRRALGPRLEAARRAGLIAKTSTYRQSASSHGSEKRVWRSLIYFGPY